MLRAAGAETRVFKDGPKPMPLSFMPKARLQGSEIWGCPCLERGSWTCLGCMGTAEVIALGLELVSELNASVDMVSLPGLQACI